MSQVEDVIEMLERMKFRIRTDELELFGEAPPLLEAIAVDERAHQLVLVAAQTLKGAGSDIDDGRTDPWRELLFAIAGLRHHLRGSGPPALSHPILLAIVDRAGVGPLCRLVEEIAEDYALFSRLDINIVDAESIEAGGEDALETSLATLLPRVRRVLDEQTTVATQDVERFWERLRGEIRAAAAKMEDRFGVSAADVTADLLAELRHVGGPGGERSVDLSHPPRPVSVLRLQGFRSFEDDRFGLPSVALLHGANGSGKTSVCEALEIIWAGQTQRMPDGDEIDVEEYARHLNRDRAEGFSIRYSLAGDEAPGAPSRVVTELANNPGALLGRTALAQHSLVEMANGSPSDRLAAFLRVSGLALPELDRQRLEHLRKTAFRDANVALEEAGIAPMRAVSTNAVGHLFKELGGEFSNELPARHHLEGASESLRRLASGAWVLSLPDANPRLPELLSTIDAALALFAKHPATAPGPSEEIAEALPYLRGEAEQLRRIADPLRLLAQQLSRAMSSVAGQEKPDPASRSPVPPVAAARWLAHIRGLEQGVAELEELIPTVSDADWRARLEEYVKALRLAISRSSADELQAMTRTRGTPSPSPPPGQRPDPELLQAAGFMYVPELSRPVIEAMGEFYAQLVERAARLDDLAARLERHPSRTFNSRIPRIMPALFRFQLVRDLMNRHGALARARESLVEELLNDRLFPIVQELVAALVRFEWYFAPLGLRSDKHGLHLNGLASRDPTKDIRFLLNAAERTVVGIAWFLALHILQPKEDRRVLVLDDPASGFDSMNKAAFVATLRSLLRLLQPEQFVITTHDDALVALLEQEFASLDGWPADFGVLRCRRTATGSSEVKQDRTGPGKGSSADLEDELRKLSFEPHEPASAI